MPIYEYVCRGCGHPFELLVLKGTALACPSCAGADLERQLSSFAVNSDQTRKVSRVTGRKKAEKTAYDKQRAEHEMFIKHQHHD